MSIVLGINGFHGAVTDYESEWRTRWFHDSACVLIKDGKVLSAVEEERLTRNKHTGTFPSTAIASCLQQTGLRLSDVDAIAVGEEGGQGEFRDPDLSPTRIAAALQESGLTSEDRSASVRLIEHHMAHAMSAYLPSGMDDALVFTMDGFGDGIAGLVMTAKGDEHHILRRLRVDQSIGNFFAAALPYFGYHHFDEYKVMGLASYGDPKRFAPLVSELYTLLPEGDFAFRVRSREELQRLLAPVGPPRFGDSPFLEHHRDLAAAYQGAFEAIVLHVLEHHQRTTGLRHLCMAGGCAQNSAFNGRLAASGLFDRIFVQPASNDAGTALGAALAVARELESEQGQAALREPLESVCWGPPVATDADILDTAAQWAPFLEADACDPFATAAELLNAGEIVGWVQGRSEFGPRALGSRSILGDPRRADSKTRINAVIKERETYRPFAPAVTAEDAHRYFQLSGTEASSAFMTFAVPVVQEVRPLLPAITHVDGTSRVQTVDKTSHGVFWRLLRSFEALSGVPVLLNTSFNSRREPIVQTVADAIACLLTSKLEHLVIGNVHLRKRPFESGAVQELHATLPAHVQLGHRIDRQGRAHHWLLHRGDRRTRLSVAAARWLLGNRNHRSEALGKELMKLWVERLVVLTPKDDR